VFASSVTQQLTVFFLHCIVLLLSVRGAELLAGVNDFQARLLENITAKFTNAPNNEFPVMSVDIKMTNKSHGGAIEDNGAVDLNAVNVTLDEVGVHISKTSGHMDGGKSEKEALNNKGEYEEVGCMKGVRFLFGWGEWDQTKGFSFYDREVRRNASGEQARIGQVYQFDNCWIYCFNGPVRHRVPQARRATKIYHRGSSMGGACLNFIMTMTCDVKEVEVRWIMKQIVNFMSNVEALLTRVVAQ